MARFLNGFTIISVKFAFVKGFAENLSNFFEFLLPKRYFLFLDTICLFSHAGRIILKP